MAPLAVFGLGLIEFVTLMVILLVIVGGIALITRRRTT
jgi:hypothetical protein